MGATLIPFTPTQPKHLCLNALYTLGCYLKILSVKRILLLKKPETHRLKTLFLLQKGICTLGFTRSCQSRTGLNLAP